MKYSNLALVTASLLSISSEAFSPSLQNSLCSSSSALYGRKKGNLSKNVSSGGISTKAKKKKQKKEEPAAAVSNNLANWAASMNEEESTSSSSTTSNSSTLKKASAASFEPFGTSSRRERSKQKQQITAAKSAEMQSILTAIQERIASNNLSIQDLLQEISQLTKSQSSITFKALLNQNLSHYSLAWVGSDEAICHLGTGLYKVPLARLQDIFLSVGRDGSGQTKTVQLLEVIRIIGPFPNVRNTLQGSIKIVSSQEDQWNTNGIQKMDRIQITYDSMMDGLGKEISAGTRDNLRFVDLDIAFCDENVIVALVPKDDSDDNSSSLFGDNGENVLLFLKEDDLDYKLEELRAA